MMVVALLKGLGLEMVPVLDDEFELTDNMEELIQKATRKSTLNKDVWAEGIVLRPLKELKEPNIGRVSFKVINPEFLLKYNE